MPACSTSRTSPPPEGVVYTHDPRPGLERHRFVHARAARTVRPGPLPHPLQQGEGALRSAAASRRPSSELEEAYLLRPRDPQVLNLLGLVYFKQEKLEKAEEIYRKLVAESPEAPTLYYNLGLICFKLNRLEEAESAFLKALELAKDNAKINFYLGYVYERLHRFQDAIYQYRQAGASLMVRRVEDKLAAGAQSRPRPRPRSAVGAPRPKEDTAKFAKVEVPAEPSSDTTLAPRQGNPSRERRPHGRRRPAPHQSRTPTSSSSPGTCSPPRPAGAAQGRPGRAHRCRRAGPHIFHSLGNNLVEVDFSGKVFIKQGTVYSYSGNLTFWVKDPRPGGQPRARDHHGDGQADPHRQGPRDHVHAGRGGAGVRGARPTSWPARRRLTPRYVPLGEGPGPRSWSWKGGAWWPCPWPASRSRSW